MPHPPLVPPASLSPAPATRIDPATTPPDHPALTDWLAHLAAGRIGTRSTTPPDIAANLARTDAIFRDRARWFAYAARTGGAA